MGGVLTALPSITSNLANAGNVVFGSGLTSTGTVLYIAMTISGTGSVTITGPGKVSLTGNNTYSGNSIINNGSTLLVATANSIGAGNLQGSGGSLSVNAGVVLSQVNATGALRLLSDVTTTGNQAWGNLTLNNTNSWLTTLTSQNGSITFNGLVDGASSKSNSLLVLTPNGNVTFNNSVGSVMPLNVLEVDSIRTNINADVLTNDQQNYCGVNGCYTAVTQAQVTANLCSTAGGDCYSKNGLAYTAFTGTTTTNNYVLNAEKGQVFIGDNGQVGFLYNTYSSYATKAFGATAPLFQNNAVFARTFISKDPMVNFGSYVNDASANSTHTLQAAAIKVNNATSAPSIQFGGSVGSTQPLFSINALTQIIDAANTMNGLIKFANGMTMTSQSNMSFGSNSINPTNVTFQTIDRNASINFTVPTTGSFNLSGNSIKSNYVNYNGASARNLSGVTYSTALSGGIITARAPAPVASSSKNSFVKAGTAEQIKLERKYDVEASVDIGDIETDDGAGNDADSTDPKKKKRKAS